MIRRRRLKLAYLLVPLLLLAASLHAPTAYSAAGDPPSGSPAGSVYQLPLEQGRSDAAPKGGGGTSAGGSGNGTANGGAGGSKGGESDSLYRTENNFGSSSHVPGVGGSGGGGGPNDPGGPPAGTGGGGGTAIAGGANAGEVTDSGNTSVSASLALLGGITLLGVSVGLLSRRFRTPRSS